VLDGAVLTREEIADAVGDETGSAAQRDKLLSGWGTLLKPVARLGLLCYGPDRGRNVTFTRPDTWLGGWREVDPDEATAEVTRRYLAANGPASRDEYARWFGTTAAHAGRMLQALGDEAMEVEHDGGREWVLAADLDAAEEPVDGVVRLLPRFDQWTVGLPRADDVAVTPDVRDRIYREAGWIWAVVLAGGRAAGIWEHDVKASTVELRVEPFTKLPRRTLDAIEVEAQRLADWLDLTLDLTIVA
ncbi:MAG: DNA glycosylase AlkZ-like family protein, partial [Nitriliruptorales bacterium]